MKRLTVVFTLLIGLFVFSSCGKGGGGGGGNNNPSEANLVVETDPSNGAVIAPSIGPFNLKVTITSAMPPGGVKIEVNAKKDDGSGNPPFFSTASNTSTAVSNFAIASTPSNSQCIVDIKVTSLSKASNQWSGTYRYSRK